MSPEIVPSKSKRAKRQETKQNGKLKQEADDKQKQYLELL